MKENELDISKLREQILKGLDLTFKKLITQKKAQNGLLVFSEKGEIKKIKASEITL